VRASVLDSLCCSLETGESGLGSIQMSWSTPVCGNP